MPFDKDNKNTDYTKQTFLDEDPRNFVGILKGFCFAQERNPFDLYSQVDVFPPGTVCSFLECNLDNVKIPEGCTLIHTQEGKNTNSVNQFYANPIDGLDWYCSDGGILIEPMYERVPEPTPEDPR